MCRKHICTVYRAIFRFRHGIPSLFCGLENRHSSNEGGGGGGGGGETARDNYNTSIAI